MSSPGWLLRSRADVADGDDWLGPDERRVLATLTRAPRRADWRLGRFTAKAAVAAWMGVVPARVQVLAAPDGAPEAWLDGTLAPVSLSLSHRAGRALAVVDDAPAVVGCDLECVEPRSDAFTDEWLAADERALVARGGAAQRPRLANLAWCAKEAAAKVRREGLRLDVRHAVSTPYGDLGGHARWQALRVAWHGEGLETRGWWWADEAWVMTVASAPDPAAPHMLDAGGGEP